MLIYSDSVGVIVTRLLVITLLVKVYANIVASGVYELLYGS